MRIAQELMVTALLVSVIGFIGPVTAAPGEHCAEIVRYDERNSRLFVVCPSLPGMSVEELRDLIERIFANFDGPPDEYFVSFFSTVALAGYK
ncbi:MAG: hypothetical protein WB812_12715, partial [Woeseiaceae bacterium]